MEFEGIFNEVMVIDDDEDARQEIMGALENNVRKFIELEGGPHLLRYLDSQPWNWVPDIAFIDLVMPVMSGYDVIRRLREKFGQRHVPLIVVTKMGMGEDIMEAQVAGADAYVKKPVTSEKLVKAILACKERLGKRGISASTMIPYFL